jgi:membrane protein
LWRELRSPGAVATAARTPAAFDAAEPYRGRAARYPWQIPPRGWKDILWRTYNEYGRSRLPSLAGGVTFYLLLATFPALAAFVSLYGLFSDVDTAEKQLVHLSAVFPSDAVNLLGAQMIRIAAQRHGALGWAFAVSALVSAWSANAGMKALFDGVNVAYNETEKRPYLPRTLLTYAATIIAVVFTVIVTAITLSVPVVYHALGLRHLALWWDPLRWVGIFAVAVLAFTLVYRVAPSRRPARWPWLIYGAVFSAAAWMAGSWGFSWYLDTFTHFGVTYGSLGAMIGFMLWVWLSVMIVLLGAELNSEIEHQTACDTTIGPPRPMGERGAVMADTLGGAFTLSFAGARAEFRDFVARQKRAAGSLVHGILRRGRGSKSSPRGSPGGRPGPRRSGDR